MQFKDKVVVITGGAHGIGKTTKEAFEAEDAIVEVIDISERNAVENGHILVDGEEMSILNWLKTLTGWKAVDTYNFSIHKDSGKTLSQIRKIYMEENEI